MLHKVTLIKWRVLIEAPTESEARLRVTCPEDGRHLEAWARWDGQDFSTRCDCGTWVGSEDAA